MLFNSITFLAFLLAVLFLMLIPGRSFRKTLLWSRAMYSTEPGTGGS